MKIEVDTLIVLKGLSYSEKNNVSLLMRTILSYLTAMAFNNALSMKKCRHFILIIYFNN